MKVLRTPDDRFQSVSDFPFEPRYIEVKGLRMHYVDEGEGNPVLCLHGEPSWSYLYRKMLPILAEHHRVVVPDMIGFGRSDKPAEKADYTFALHYETLEEFLNQLDLKRITLVGQDWGGLLGLPLAAEHPERFVRLVIMNTGLPTGEQPMSEAFMRWREFARTSDDMDIGRVVQQGTVSTLSPETLAAYDAPFPDASYKAGALQFPLLVPISPDAEAADAMRKARAALRKWTRPALVMFSDSDPITRGGDKGFRRLIPSACEEPEIVIEDAGHFLQEDKGEEIARRILEFIERRSVE